MEFTQPAMVHYGRGCLLQAVPVIPGRVVAVVTGRGFARRGHWLDQVIGALQQTGRMAVVFDQVPPEPAVEDVEACLVCLKGAGAEAVLAIGGGSVLDVGKAAAALYPGPLSVQEYLQGAPPPVTGLFMAAAPTTAGTGSEATPNAVLFSRSDREKKSIRTPGMLPRLVVLDPELTATCPPAVTAHAGMDALVQGIEALFSRQSTPFSDTLAAAGILAVDRSLFTAYATGGHMAAREDLLYGAFLIGMAFSQVRLGAVHGLAHPVGVCTGAPHGLVCARLMPPVLRRNAAVCPAKLARLAALLEGDPVARVEALIDALGLGRRFDAVISRADWERLLAYTATAGSMLANPAAFDATEQAAILGEAGLAVEA
ncbi:MAG: iron-containing alcohol dehydrogenase [Planctomycetota bacterium]